MIQVLAELLNMIHFEHPVGIRQYEMRWNLHPSKGRGREGGLTVSCVSVVPVVGLVIINTSRAQLEMYLEIKF